jgi:MAF protein
LILASGSPRRLELLGHLGVPFEVVVSGFDELSIEHPRAETLAKRLAASKVAAVATEHPEAVVLGADTIVVYRGEMLGKPEGPDEAREMLQKLRGRIHRVVTGVALSMQGKSRPAVTHVVSRVHMRHYTDDEIEDTIARAVPFDKAGGYGIQDPALRPVEHCDGCFCSVMGLPLWTVARLLHGAGFDVDVGGMPERCAACPSRCG